MNFFCPTIIADTGYNSLRIRIAPVNTSVINILNRVVNTFSELIATSLIVVEANIYARTNRLTVV